MADALDGSKHANMKELRFEASDSEWRAAFAFDPERRAVLLVAGDKSGGRQKRFYYLSTLRSYVEALGGELELVVRLPERPVLRQHRLGDALQNPRSHLGREHRRHRLDTLASATDDAGTPSEGGERHPIL
jgi:Phage derived protein Gp49-like (DUF891)